MKRLVLAALFSLGACSAGPGTVMMQGELPPDVTGYFPADYWDARDAFRGACARLTASVGAVCQAYTIGGEPTSTSGRDPARDLTIDTAFIPAKQGVRSDRLLTVQSGIHGSEAATGSAAERLLMDRHIDALRDKGIDVLLIHAINPWGFCSGRRTDANNVNLNRNFRTDWDNPDANEINQDNALYGKVQSIAVPEGPIANLRGAIARILIELAWASITGTDVADGLDSGQYYSSKGLNFGGNRAQPQVRFIDDAVVPTMKRYQKIVFLDFHTGLGVNGQLALIRGKNVEDVEAKAEALDRLLGRPKLAGGKRCETGMDIVVKDPDCPGMFKTEGDVIDYVPYVLDQGLRSGEAKKEVVSVTAEFGTMGDDGLKQALSAARMILENQARTYGCESKDVCDEVGDDFSELFNPVDVDWRRKVMAESDELFRKVEENFR